MRGWDAGIPLTTLCSFGSTDIGFGLTNEQGRLS